MNKNIKFIKTIKKGGKFIFWWKFIQAEVWSSRNEDGTYKAEGIYIPFELEISKKVFGKLVDISHTYLNK